MTEILTTQALIEGLLKIGSEPDITALFDLLVEEAPRLVGAEECSIFWKDGEWRDPYRRVKEPKITDAYYRRDTYEEKKHLIGVDYYKPGEGLTGWVIKHGKSLNIPDITNGTQLKMFADDLSWSDKGKGFQKSSDRDRQKAFLAVPIIIDGQVVGVIRIAKTTEPNATSVKAVRIYLKYLQKILLPSFKELRKITCAGFGINFIFQGSVLAKMV